MPKLTKRRPAVTLGDALKCIKKLEVENQKLSDQVDRLAAKLAAKEAK